MKRIHQAWVAVVLVGVSGLSCAGRSHTVSVSQSTAMRLRAASDTRPISFEPNRGQTDAPVKFLARGRGYTLWLTDTADAVLALHQQAEQSATARQTVVRMQVVGGNPAPHSEGVDARPGKTHYFLGKAPASWCTNIPTYAKVKYAHVYPGIDLVYYGTQGQLEYDVIVNPGASPETVTLRFEGAQAINIDPQGRLILSTAIGELRQHAPLVYQEVDGVKRFLSGRYVRKGTTEIGFQVARYDRHTPLVIDPLLIYSTYLGGVQGDDGQAIAVDSAGYAYVAGTTSSPNFPLQNPVQGSYVGIVDAFVTKLTPDGTTLVYSTYLGGSGADGAEAIVVDAAGHAYVTGTTISTNFPTQNPFQSAEAGNRDAFVTKLSPDGATLVYSTYLGGSGYDEGYGIAIDAAGSAYVTGTASPGFPLQQPFQGTPGGNGTYDGFATKFTPDGSALVYSTYLGGSAYDEGFGIAVDAAGHAYVIGETSSSNFPLQNPLQGTYGGGTFDAFVTKFTPNGAALVYSTYLGGAQDDRGRSIAVDNAGNVYVTGETNSSDFPLQNPAQGSLGGATDAFVTKFSPNGATLVYSTYLGGMSAERGNSVVVDVFGQNAYVTGYTGSSNFPTSNPFNATLSGLFDTFLTRVSPTGSAWVYSTHLGGTTTAAGFPASNPGNGIAVDQDSRVYVTGQTNAVDFPLQNPFPSTPPGSSDNGHAFVTKLEALPAGVLRYGASTPSCFGSISLGVADVPKAGNATFAFTVANAPSNSVGLLIVGTGQDLVGTPVLGITAHVVYNNPAQPFVLFPVVSDALGNATVPMPIPTGTAGAHVFVQTGWGNTASCGGAGTLSASDALDITVQP